LNDPEAAGISVSLCPIDPSRLGIKRQSLCPRRLWGEVGSLGFDGESVIGPARVYLKPYWRERRVSYFEGETG